MKRQPYLTLCFAICLLAILGGCGTPPAPPEEGVPIMTEEEYQTWLNHNSDPNSQVVLGDILLVYDQQDSELNNVYWVIPGTLRDPLLGSMTTAGSIRPALIEEPVVVVNKTPEQVKQILEEAYKAKDIQASLTVKNLRDCVLLEGEFNDPGLYDLTEKTTFGDLLEKAKDFSDWADKTVIGIYRKTNGTVERFALNYKKDKSETLAFEILPGDRISVLRKVNYSTN